MTSITLLESKNNQDDIFTKPLFTQDLLNNLISKVDTLSTTIDAFLLNNITADAIF